MTTAEADAELLAELGISSPETARIICSAPTCMGCRMPGLLMPRRTVDKPLHRRQNWSPRDGD